MTRLEIDSPTPINLNDYTKFKLPNLGNMPTAQLLDTLGTLKDVHKVLERYIGVYEQAFLAQLKDPTTGTLPFKVIEFDYKLCRYQATISPASGQNRLNGDKVRAFVGNDEEIYATLCTLTESKGFSLKITKKDE